MLVSTLTKTTTPVATDLTLTATGGTASRILLRGTVGGIMVDVNNDGEKPENNMEKTLVQYTEVNVSHFRFTHFRFHSSIFFGFFCFFHTLGVCFDF